MKDEGDSRSAVRIHRVPGYPRSGWRPFRLHPSTEWIYAVKLKEGWQDAVSIEWSDAPLFNRCSLCGEFAGGIGEIVDLTHREH